MQKFFIDFCDIKKIGGQFGTRPNLAPDPIWHRTHFGTGPIWHRTQFGTKSVKESIWHQECKRVYLAPKLIWHRSQFGTIQMEHISLL